MSLAADLRGFLLAALLLAPAAASASGAAEGRELYQTYCASCHGVAADGNGPLAESLRTTPPDLTRLAERYGMPLPRHILVQFIDGRRDVKAHGPRDMPVWGRTFFDEAYGSKAARERFVRHAIFDHLEAIQSIQRGALAPSRAG